MNYKDFKSKYNIRLNQQQESAVVRVNGQTLLLAVPGSGKTTVIVARLGYMLMCCNIRPENILTMTYNVSAARDMKKRFCDKFEDAVKLPEFRTINGFCATVIMHYERVKHTNAFSLVEENQITKIIRAIYLDMTHEFPSESTIKDIKTKLVYSRNMMLKTDEIKKMKIGEVDFYDFFNFIGDDKCSCWQKLSFNEKLKSGDVIAFINPNKKGRYGHVAVVEEELYRDVNKIVVKIIDSSQIKHFDDFRQTKKMGIGCGIIELYMNEDKYFKSTIRNIYYDTPNYLLIRTSIEKPEYKEKLRIRSYKMVNKDDEVFVELKKKYKKIVYKRREILPYNSARLFLDKKVRPNDLQITKEIEYTLNYYQDLKPTIFLSYDRLAYIGKEDLNFRITLDRNIMWRDYDIDLAKEAYGDLILDQDLVLMEVKTVMGLPRWLLDFLGENNIYKVSFSKYGNVYKEIINKEKEKEEINYA